LKKFTYKEIKKKVAVYDNLLEFAKSLSWIRKHILNNYHFLILW
jgi:hypothetical protein